MRAVVYTDSLHLYASVYGALRKEGWKVGWKEGQGLALAGLDQLEKGEVVVWSTPWGLRAYDPLNFAFLTQRDDPKSLVPGLKGWRGLRLLPGEREVLLALGRGVEAKGKALAEHLGWPLHRARFFLKGLHNKFGLPLGDLLRLARHQVQVVGFEGHAKPLAGVQAKPFLHVAGEEEAQGHGSLEVPTVGQPLGIQACENAF